MGMDGISAEDGAVAVKLARAVLQETIAGGGVPEPEMPPSFQEKRGVFVTLNIRGSLRGCIGFPRPILPLSEAIHEAALAAAQEDPRFPPVQARELAAITIEVTILTPPRLVTVPPAERPDAVTVGKHGLIISGYGRGGLLLPQVAVEYGWDATTFLDQVCVKAGLPPKTWRNDDTELYTFEGQIFHEEEHA